MKLILNGGGSGDLVKNSREKLNNFLDKNNIKKALYIPFAWPDSNYLGCYEFIKNELKDVNISDIDMVKNSDELYSKNLNDYAFIYIGGGNTYKLLKTLKDGHCFEKIKNYLLYENGIIYGGSAGAIIFGKDLDSCNTDDENYVNLEDNSAFNLLNNFSLLCHFTNRENSRTKLSKNYLINLSKIKPIYAIPEEDTIIVNDNIIEFIGTKPYYEFINGKMIKKFTKDLI